MFNLRLFAVVAALAVTGVAAAQDSKPAPKTDAPHRDPEAVKVLEGHDALVYVPREEGLKDVTFTLRLPMGVFVDMKWMAPDKTAWTARPGPDAKEDVAKRMMLLIATPTFRADMDAQVPSFIKTMIGERESVRFSKDAMELFGPKQIKITAKAPETLAVIKEAVATFDDQGRVKALSVTSPLGAVSDLESTYEERKGKSVVKEMKMTTKTAATPQTMTLVNEYSEVGGFILISKLVQKNGTQGDLELVFSDHKVNGGLTEADFKK